MRERPILFSAPMVRAILDGRKTMTRRVVKPYRGMPVVNLAKVEPALCYSGQFNDPSSWGYEFLDDGAPASLEAWTELCPYGQPGDRLWVRESFCDARGGGAARVLYRSTGDAACRWTPSIHMPRWASRITLEITGVRMERLQDISETDVLAEGFQTREGEAAFNYAGTREYFIPDQLERRPTGPVAAGGNVSAQQAFRELWESIHDGGSWDDNPWVWVVEFRRIEQPEAR